MNDTGQPDAAGYRFIGKPLPRKEDERLVTGRGQFTDDFHLDGQVHAVMVRSPYPHARIVAIDSAAATKMPGVLGVFTGADCAADKLAPIPHDPLPKTKFDMKLHGPGGRRRVHRPARLVAGRQGAPCRRGRRHGGGRDQGAGDGRSRSGVGRIRGIAFRPSFRRRDASRRTEGLGRGAKQPDGRDLFRRRRSDRPGVRARGPCRHQELSCRPRHRCAARAARSSWQLRRRDRPLHALCRFRRRGPAEERALDGARHSPGQPARARLTTSAAISVRAIACSSNSASCCGRHASSAGR